MGYRIEGFPEELATVPETPLEYIKWRDDVLALREYLHRVCEHPGREREAIMLLCKHSKPFWINIFGAILDPKGSTDYRINDDGEIEEFKRPKGWYPWILYPFQVGVLDWHDDIVSKDNDETGKADGVLEKSRDMGLTWLFVAIAGHGYLFDEDYLAMFLSYKEDAVDSSSPKSMFYKLRALLGINQRVSYRCHAPGTPYHGARVRLPVWMVPAGFEAKLHDRKLSLLHPTKTNQITGESTTGKTATGDRQNEVFLDEGAKNKEIGSIWSGLTAVTDHRFAFSSAFRDEGDGMYNLVKKARAAHRNPQLDGPSFMSLPWHLHPMRDESWYRNMRARHSDDLAGFEREYEINWDAGAGDFVYGLSKQIMPGHYPYDIIGGNIWGSIDPGIRDPSAIGLFQYQPGTENIWRIFDALVLQTPSARFLAPILMGWPRGHDMRTAYADYASESIQQFMDTMWTIRQSGKTINWVGDPYGNNVGGANSVSFYDELFMAAHELNATYTTWEGAPLEPVSLHVIAKYDEGARLHRVRKDALVNMLPRLRFNDTARVNYILEAIQSYKYRSTVEGRSTQNEPMEPLHDWSSHPTTMVEYFAVVNKINESFSGAAPKVSKARTGAAPRKEVAWTR